MCWCGRYVVCWRGGSWQQQHQGGIVSGTLSDALCGAKCRFFVDWRDTNSFGKKNCHTGAPRPQMFPTRKICPLALADSAISISILVGANKARPRRPLCRPPSPHQLRREGRGANPRVRRRRAHREAVLGRLPGGDRAVLLHSVRALARAGHAMSAATSAPLGPTRPRVLLLILTNVRLLFDDQGAGCACLGRLESETTAAYRSS
jgi:hypothetical protein